MTVVLTPLPTISSAISLPAAKRKALQLINAFQSSAVMHSDHYTQLRKSAILDGLKESVNREVGILDQKNSSLCGPAAFFYPGTASA